MPRKSDQFDWIAHGQGNACGSSLISATLQTNSDASRAKLFRGPGSGTGTVTIVPT